MIWLAFLMAGVLWFVGFCVLCGIFYRLGEARDLLRYLAEQYHAARLKPGNLPPSARDLDSQT